MSASVARQPEIILLADESRESQYARRLLSETGVRYEVWPADGPEVPMVTVGGRSIQGRLDGIEAVADLYGKRPR
jgi:hypothetical protein